jgi:hypothetical protein
MNTMNTITTADRIKDLEAGKQVSFPHGFCFASLNIRPARNGEARNAFAWSPKAGSTRWFGNAPDAIAAAEGGEVAK